MQWIKTESGFEVIYQFLEEALMPHKGINRGFHRDVITS